MRTATMRGLLTTSMMTPAERAKGRFMRAPDGHGDGGKGLTQADIDAAVEKAVGPLKDSVDKLEQKNKELIGENRKLKSAGEIKPEDLAAAEDRADKAIADLADAQKALKTAGAEREKAVKALETEQGFTHKLLVENGLREQLAAAGVSHPAHQKGAIAILASQVQVAADGENRVAKVGEKALPDYVKEWATTDEGKAFVTAPANGGGGAPGSTTTTGGGKQVARPAFDAMDQVARGAFIKEGGKVVDA